MKRAYVPCVGLGSENNDSCKEDGRVFVLKTPELEQTSKTK